jgi:general nucleoside transport system permease protein
VTATTTTGPGRGQPPAGPAVEFFRRYFSLQPILVPICAIGLAVLVGGVIILLVGENPFTAYWALLRGMFGSGDRLAASLARSTPFIGAALAVAFAFRAGLFNIGVEGQLLVGATVAAWVGTWDSVGDLPTALAVPAVLLAGTLGGALYGLVPGALKVRTGAHEVITTIMLNNIALLLVRWMVNSTDPVILRDETASVARSETITDGAFLPRFVGSSPPLHWGFVIMLALCVFVWFVLQRTTSGFEIRMVGANPHAAHYAGVGVSFVVVMVMTMAGGFAGLAGAGEIAGTSHFLSPGVFLAVGFDSIAIALLARANPFAVVPAAVLWGSMLAGAPLMQQETGLSIDIVRIVQALVLLFVAADVIVRTVFRIRRKIEGGFEEPQFGTEWGGVA